MLITEQFVFIHVPKTGGTWVQGVCAHLAIPNDLDTHTPRYLVPAEFQHLPVLAFVRNPWDWYVSYWEWGKANFPPDEWLYEALRLDQDDFAVFVERCCTGRDFPFRVGEWMRDHDLDFFTATVRDLLFPRGAAFVGRFEHLVDDLLEFCDTRGVELGIDVRAVPPANVSKRGAYRDYYTPETRDLVGARTRGMQRTYGYRF